jgi:hypothetical protein
MCLLCDDEKAYQAYMAYLDEVERQGRTADSSKAIDAALATIAGQPVPDTTLSLHTPDVTPVPPARPRSPFSCDPVDE